MKLVIDFILVTGILSIVMILFLVIKRKQGSFSHNLLLVLLSLLFCVIITFYAFLHGIKSIYYAFFLIYFTIGYIAGPFFYLYVKSLFIPKAEVKKNIWKHFFPAIIILLFWNIPLLISNISGALIFPYLKILLENSFDDIEIVLQLLFFLFYGILSFRLLKKYQQQIKNNYSDLSDKDLAWVEYLILGSIITMVTNGVLQILQLGYGENDWNAEYITALPLVGMTIYLGYYGLTQSQILLPSFLVQSTVEEIIPATNKLTPAKHHLSNVSESEIKKLKELLLKTLEKDKLYLNEDLTLGMLADAISTTDKKLSALLNHYLNTSFYDFINGYRVAEVKAKITAEQYSHYTLLAIGLDSGFKSKASFNRIFKKVSGFSPSKYKSKLLSEKSNIA